MLDKQEFQNAEAYIENFKDASQAIKVLIKIDSTQVLPILFKVLVQHDVKLRELCSKSPDRSFNLCLFVFLYHRENMSALLDLIVQNLDEVHFNCDNLRSQHDNILDLEVLRAYAHLTWTKIEQEQNVDQNCYESLVKTQLTMACMSHDQAVQEGYVVSLILQAIRCADIADYDASLRSLSNLLRLKLTSRVKRLVDNASSYLSTCKLRRLVRNGAEKELILK